MRSILSQIPLRVAFGIALLAAAGGATAISAQPTGSSHALTTASASATAEPSDSAEPSDTPEASDSAQPSASSNGMEAVVQQCQAARASASASPGAERGAGEGIGKCVSAQAKHHGRDNHHSPSSAQPSPQS